MKDIRVGIFQGSSPIEPSVANLVRYLAEMQYIGYSEKRRGIELLIIPHGTGVSPFLRTFIHKNKTVIPSLPTDPYALFFLEYTLQYYVESEIPIFFLGESAAYPWDSVGKTAIVNQSLHFIENDNQDVEILERDSDRILGFKIKNSYGFLNPNSPTCSSTLGGLITKIRLEVNSIQNPGEEPETEAVYVW